MATTQRQARARALGRATAFAARGEDIELRATVTVPAPTTTPAGRLSRRTPLPPDASPARHPRSAASNRTPLASNSPTASPPLVSIMAEASWPKDVKPKSLKQQYTLASSPFTFNNQTQPHTPPTQSLSPAIMVSFTNVVTGVLIGAAGLVNAYSGDMTFHPVPFKNEAGQTVMQDVTRRRWPTSVGLSYLDLRLGACGGTNGAGDFIVALSQSQYNGNCGKSIKITYQGKTAVAKVVGLCPGCGSGSIDASPAVFNSLANPDLGRIHVDWGVVDNAKVTKEADKLKTRGPSPPDGTPNIPVDFRCNRTRVGQLVHRLPPNTINPIATEQYFLIGCRRPGL
ncbi:Uu.00g051400.m01.CDS01 [Anthostomella pinea]|uniref:Uu.00g051400.m01.CDS01 n=1 Tax=Anthostomella pinea TaxID=933095 RepID=A0AAI8VU10_9PEZI|nr:Uu.00g051400.m01.CDS01 [Anthostomella pinea]